MATDDVTTLSEAGIEAVLTEGSLVIEGRLVAASNASFRGHVDFDGVSLGCIYKPVRGERPLWDFPDGALAGRELAARLVSAAGGWHVVPPTVLRDGPLGLGMCQHWIEAANDHDLIDVVDTDFREEGWIAVLQAEDHYSRPVLLVHRDDGRLRDMAVFDVVINNADRKGGHVLVADDGGVWGCDHGVSFHVENKLRTVLWGWADEPLRDRDVAALGQLDRAFVDGLDEALTPLLTDIEIAALHSRVADLSTTLRMPVPEGSWPAIPWPAF